jgi:hypothetical protein
MNNFCSIFFFLRDRTNSERRGKALEMWKYYLDLKEGKIDDKYLIKLINYRENHEIY